jgi:flagella basal body P-ring formation protein FlgA
MQPWLVTMAIVVIGGGLASIASAAEADALEHRVAEAARAELDGRLRQAGLVEPRIDVSAVPLMTAASRARGVVPCSQPAEIEAIDTRQASRMRFAAVCMDGWRQEWIAKATVSAEVVVANGDVPAGRPLAAGDVGLQRRDVTALPDALSDPDAAIGRSSRRALHTGDPLRRGQLIDAVVVKRGDAVRIVARNGEVEVTAAGSAMEAGASGAVIRVRNERNGIVIRGRVIGAGVVEPADAVMATPSTP